MELAHIETALARGCHLHAFLSGGGLRVIRVEDTDGTLKGYGEHPHVEDALAHANLDVEAGGRPYEEVYGKQFPHYLTGDTKTTSGLDAWVRQGNTFDVRKEGDEFVFDLVGYGRFDLPSNIQERMDKGEDNVEWDDDRGFRYCAKHSRFPNGDPAIMTSVVSQPDGVTGADPWMWPIRKTGRGSSFWDAFNASWEATPMEIKRN